jgi:hypothetical protein
MPRGVYKRKKRLSEAHAGTQSRVSLEIGVKSHE